MRIGLVVCLSLAFAFGGCRISVGDGGGKEEAPGELLETTESIEMGKADMVQVDLRMGAGELQVEGGAGKLMEGDFAYNVAAWKPEVRYEESGFRGRLTVNQGKGTATLGEMQNRWTVRLSNRAAIDLGVHCGAGESRLDLRGLNLRSVNVKMGAGQVEMDLRGEYAKDVDVNVEGGVGEATIRVPKGVPVEAVAKGGLGEIRVEGLRRGEDGRWVSEAKGRDKAGIRLNVRGGIGQINIRAE